VLRPHAQHSIDYVGLFEQKGLDELPRVRSLLTGSKELVRYFKKSGNMKLLPTSLKQEVCTRWNTMFYLLESVLKNYEEVSHILLTNNEMYRSVTLYANL